MYSKMHETIGIWFFSDPHSCGQSIKIYCRLKSKVTVSTPYNLQVTSKTVARRNIKEPSTPKQRAKPKQNPDFTLGHVRVTMEDLPHPSKLTKKKFQQKKFSKLDLGRMYASQLKKKLEQFNL